jgi:hypothetical protein
MNFLKQLFSNNSRSDDNDDGIYLYVRPKGCEEVIRVRLNPRNDLTVSEQGGYFVHKTARGTHRCFNPVEMSLYFDQGRKLQNNDIKGGELVELADYEAWQAKLAEKKARVSSSTPAEEQG